MFNETPKKSVSDQCGVCSAINFATVDLFLQLISMKENEV
jgi:hypothetical protein